MTINPSILIACASLFISAFFGILNVKRNLKKDDKKDASELTTVIVKLENIGNGITEIKSEMSNLKNDIKEDRERIIRLEESAKQAHKRLDTIELQKNNR